MSFIEELLRSPIELIDNYSSGKLFGCYPSVVNVDLSIRDYVEGCQRTDPYVRFMIKEEDKEFLERLIEFCAKLGPRSRRNPETDKPYKIDIEILCDEDPVEIHIEYITNAEIARLISALELKAEEFHVGSCRLYIWKKELISLEVIS